MYVRNSISKKLLSLFSKNISFPLELLQQLTKVSSTAKIGICNRSATARLENPQRQMQP